MTKQRIGYIGVGPDGPRRREATSCKHGYPLTVMGHRNRAPVDDLVARGAREAATPADVAQAVRRRVPVPAVVGGGGGHALRRRTACSPARPRGSSSSIRRPSDPRSTQRIGADLAARGLRMVDAPVGRTPKEAEAGKLSTFVGGDPDDGARDREADHRVLRRHDHRRRRARRRAHAEARQQLHLDRHERRDRRSA